MEIINRTENEQFEVNKLNIPARTRINLSNEDLSVIVKDVN